MNLQALDKQLDRLLVEAQELQLKELACRRDSAGNLLVLKNNTTYLFPRIRFRPYQTQKQNLLFVEDIKRFLVVWPRRAGKEVWSWNMIIQGALEKPGLYLMIYPNNVRARKVLWEGSITMPDESSYPFLNMIPSSFLLRKPNHQEMTLKLINGSVIWVLGSDVDPNKLRGTNPRGVCISEFAYCDPRVLRVLMPALRQSKGWLIAQTTFNGMNHAYKLYIQNKDNPEWHCSVESVETLLDENGNRYITDEMIEQDRQSGMAEWFIQQEYYSSVTENEETMYFAVQLKFLQENNKIIPDFYIHNSPCYAAWDLGRNDNNFCILFQMDERRNPVIIGCLEDRNKTPDFYFTELDKMAARKGLRIVKHFHPHDGKKRDYNTGQNTVDFGAQYGKIVEIVPQPTSKINAIIQSRKMMYRTRFNGTHCERLLECIAGYTKVFDEKNNIYKDEPLHNWASHGVDAYQTMTLAIDSDMISTHNTGKVLYPQLY